MNRLPVLGVGELEAIDAALASEEERAAPGSAWAGGLPSLREVVRAVKLRMDVPGDPAEVARLFDEATGASYYGHCFRLAVLRDPVAAEALRVLVDRLRAAGVPGAGTA